MLRAQAPIASVPEVLRSINRSRYRSPRHRARASARSSSLDTRKKSHAAANKSFNSACYQEAPATPSRKQRSMSVERSRNISLGDIRPQQDRKKLALSSKHRNLKSTGRLENNVTGAELGPKDSNSVRQLMECGNSELSQKQFSTAIKYYKRVLREEPTNLDAMYNRAVCYMHINQHKMAIPDLLSVSKENPYYDRQLYIALAMCFVAGGDVQTAIRQLTKGLSKYSSFSEGFITRGKLFIQLQKWDKAVQDFTRAANIDIQSGEALLGLADAYRGLGDYANAAEAYAKAAQRPDTLISSLMKRSRMYLELGQNFEALEDLNTLLAQIPDSAETYFVKAQTLLSLGEHTEASLAFEQAIKYDNEDKEYTGVAIYHLGLLKIKQKDFYGAMYTFRRAREPKTQFKDQQILKMYAESVLSLMKRKFQEGITLLTKLIKRKPSVLSEYEPSLYAYRGYGFAALEKHQRAVKDFQCCRHFSDLDPATAYNLVISQGIVAAESSNYERALYYFAEAQKLFTENMEPVAYKALTVLTAAKGKISKVHAFEEARDCFDKGIEKRPTEAELYFLRAVLSYYQDNCLEAIPDLEQAIEKAEDNVAAHYLMRGLCYAKLKLLQEALQDFTIAIQLNENLPEAYLYRGRCALLMDDASLAFADFQKLILLKQDDPKVHVHAGNLLMFTASFEDAAKAFANANDLHPTAEAHLQIFKCYLHLGELSHAIDAVTKAQSLEPSNAGIAIDKELLVVLQEASTWTGGNSSQALTRAIGQLTKLQGKTVRTEVCDDSYIHFYKGVMWMALQDFGKALQEMKQAMSQEEMKHMTTPNGMIVPHDNYEIVYDMALCYAMMQHFEKSYQLLEQLANALPVEFRGKLIYLMGLVKLGTQKGRGTAQSDSSLESDDVIEMDIFSDQSSAFSHFPPLSFQLPGHSPVVSPTQRIRIACSLPKPAPPPFDFDIEEGVLDYFTIKAIKCRPEAPWLNRVNGTIQFTEDMQMITSQNVSDTEEAMLADLKEDPGTPDDGEISEEEEVNARRCHSATYLPSGQSQSSEVGRGSKRTDKLLIFHDDGRRAGRFSPESALQQLEDLCSPIAQAPA